MAYKYEWVEEPWILRVNYSGLLSRGDLDAVMSYCLDVVEKHPTYFLVDLTDVNELDSNTIRSRSAVQFTGHSNTKWLAIVGLTGPLPKLAVAVLGRFTCLKNFNDAEV